MHRFIIFPKKAGKYLEGFAKSVFPDGYVPTMPKTPSGGTKRKASSSGSTPRASQRRRLADHTRDELADLASSAKVRLFRVWSDFFFVHIETFFFFFL